MKRIALLAMLAVSAIASAQTSTMTAHVAWTAPTKNTDGSSITAPITYRVYTSGAVIKDSVAVASADVPAMPGQCFQVSAVVAGIESALSSAACIGKQPNPPTGVQVTVTVTVNTP